MRLVSLGSGSIDTRVIPAIAQRVGIHPVPRMNSVAFQCGKESDLAASACYFPGAPRSHAVYFRVARATRKIPGPWDAGCTRIYRHRPRLRTSSHPRRLFFDCLLIEQDLLLIHTLVEINLPLVRGCRNSSVGRTFVYSSLDGLIKMQQ